MQNNKNTLAKTLAKISLGLAACAAVTVTAYAAVTYNPSSGGFVGKGDVQLAFGWNNKALQTNASGVTFTWDSEETYNVTCEWYTGPTHNTTHHVVTRKQRYGINTTITHEARKNSNGKDGEITGFILSAVTGPIGSGDAPSIGANCPNGNSGIITAFSLSSTSPGGLCVNFGESSVPLPNTSVEPSL